ncbi:MAG: hypothetical protein JJE09_03270 [Bacteroidia bacterium]|nr:hypothetical protein [Bacteroidia bacterium]
MRLIVALFLFILPSLAMGQVMPFFEDLVSTSIVKPTTRESNKLNDFIKTLHSQRRVSENKFLKSTFKATHQKFLKSYSQYSDFGEIFKNGKYDCLTATALFSVILSEMHFDYKIIETNYHIFILVDTESGQVMLETTDRLFGFVEDPMEINNKIDLYRQNRMTNSGNDKLYYYYTFDLYNEVGPYQVPGLLYFNQAIKAYNRGDLLACASFLEQSRKIYESPRVDELTVVLVKSVLESNLSTDAKSKVLRQYRYLVMSKGSPVAVR